MCSLGTFCLYWWFDWLFLHISFWLAHFLKSMRAIALFSLGPCFGCCFFGECCSMCHCMWLVSYCDYMSEIMHGGRCLCTVLSVLSQLSHWKAALTLPLRACSQQLSVKYGDLYAWLSSRITYIGRRLGIIFFSGFRWIISSKSSVNISVASWFTTVVSELLRFIRGFF